MEREQTTEVKNFIELLQTLNESQQIGLNLMIDGLKLVADKQKSGRKNR